MPQKPKLRVVAGTEFKPKARRAELRPGPAKIMAAAAQLATINVSDKEKRSMDHIVRLMRLLDGRTATLEQTKFLERFLFHAHGAAASLLWDEPPTGGAA